MNALLKFAVAGTMIAASIGTASAQAMVQSRQPTRAAASLPNMVAPAIGVRQTKRVNASDSLIGAPLVLLVVGGIAAVATIVAVATDNDSDG